MERRNIVLLGLLSLVAAVPIMGRSPQSLASGYFGSPTRSSSDNLSIKRYVAAGDRAYEVGTLDGAFPQIGWHVKVTPGKSMSLEKTCCCLSGVRPRQRKNRVRRLGQIRPHRPEG